MSDTQNIKLPTPEHSPAPVTPNSQKVIDKLTGDEKGQYKITTAHGTYYIFDLDTWKAMRIPAESRNEMKADNKWFRVTNFNTIELGQPILWLCNGIERDDYYDWRQTTPVAAIEKFESKSQFNRIIISNGGKL